MASYTFKVIILFIHAMPRPIMIRAAATSILPGRVLERTPDVFGIDKA